MIDDNKHYLMDFDELTFVGRSWSIYINVFIWIWIHELNSNSSLNLIQESSKGVKRRDRGYQNSFGHLIAYNYSCVFPFWIKLMRPVSTFSTNLLLIYRIIGWFFIFECKRWIFYEKCNSIRLSELPKLDTTIINLTQLEDTYFVEYKIHEWWIGVEILYLLFLFP